METKHTPGPWTIGCIIEPDDDRPSYRLGGRGLDTADTMHANATLMMAAPDLLAACKSALNWLSYCDMTDTAQYERLLNAIARAEAGGDA